MNFLCSTRIISLKIKRNNGSMFAIEIDKYSTIHTLKEKLFDKIGLYSDQFRLVFKGQVLKDDLSLSYYNITNNSVVFFVPLPNKETTTRPYQLLNRMMQLIEKLPNTSSSEYTITVNEINEIMKDPRVIAFSRINPDVEQLFSDAQEIIDFTERPPSRKTLDFIAKSKDAMFDQFDQSPDGLRILQSYLEESDESVEYSDNDSDEYDEFDSFWDGTLNQKTNINYSRVLQSKPLPDPWSKNKRKNNILQNTALRLSVPVPSFLYQMNQDVKRLDDNFSLRKTPTFDVNYSLNLKSKFSAEMALLKNKGFNDEKKILQALSETNGNVQQAEQILKHNFL